MSAEGNVTVVPQASENSPTKGLFLCNIIDIRYKMT